MKCRCVGGDGVGGRFTWRVCGRPSLSPLRAPKSGWLRKRGRAVGRRRPSPSRWVGRGRRGVYVAGAWPSAGFVVARAEMRRAGQERGVAASLGWPVRVSGGWGGVAGGVRGVGGPRRGREWWIGAGFRADTLCSAARIYRLSSQCRWPDGRPGCMPLPCGWPGGVVNEVCGVGGLGVGRKWWIGAGFRRDTPCLAARIYRLLSRWPGSRTVILAACLFPVNGRGGVVNEASGVDETGAGWKWWIRAGFRRDTPCPAARIHHFPSHRPASRTTGPGPPAHLLRSQPLLGARNDERDGRPTTGHVNRPPLPPPPPHPHFTAGLPLP